MGKNSSCSAQRAWRFLRMSLLWARKGWILRKRVMQEMRSLVSTHLKTLGHNNRDQICYGEYELSFDKTPIFQTKIHRPSSMRFLIPCIKPHHTDFDYGYDFDCDYNHDGGVSYRYEKEEDEEEEEIDERAEEFINKFYQEIKLQRQISYLQHKGCKMSTQD